MLRSTCAEIDLSAIKDNIKAIRARIGNKVKIIPAIEGDGYGHGAVEVSKAIIEAKADALGVALVEEAIQLRDAGIDSPILILGCSMLNTVEYIVHHNIISNVCDIEYAKALSNNAIKQGNTARVHIKVDTGMGRIGIAPDRVIDFVQQISMLPGLFVEGLFTHFASSDEEDRTFTISQINTLKQVILGLKRNGIDIPMVHASNSGGTLAFLEADFDAVRPGIIAYGLYPSTEVARSIKIREALTLKTSIAFLRESQVGFPVSYGCTHILKRKSTVATLPIGYADGYSRMLSNSGEAVVRGIRVPIIGRVCMDQCLVDVTEVSYVHVGDEVVLYGGGYDYLSTQVIADKIGTIPYEVLCAISKRVPRLYIN